MHYSIDRFEDDLAVLQDDKGNNIDVECSLLPSDVRQGDVLIYDDGKWKHDSEETVSRRDRIRQLQERLLKKNKRTTGDN